MYLKKYLKSNNFSHLFTENFLIITLRVTTVISILFLFFVGTEYNYGGESVLIHGFLRMALNKSPLAIPTETPVVISPFSPYFYWIYLPFIKLFNIQSVNHLVALGRSIQLFIIFLIFNLLKKTCKIHFSRNYSGSVLELSFLILFLMFLGNFLSIRPDLHSFFFELLGLSVLLDTREELAKKKKLFFLSGIFFGLAFVMKLNTIGAFTGSLLYLLLYDQKRNVLLILLGFVITSSVLFGIAYFILDSALTVNLIQSLMKNSSYSLRGWYETVFDKIIYGFYIRNLITFVIVMIGLKKLSANYYDKTKLIIFTLCFSLIVGSIGLVSPGSYYNYLFGYFLISIIPFSIGYDELLKKSKESLSAYSINLGLMIFCFPILLSKFSQNVDLLFNRNKNFNINTVKFILDNEFPNGKIYTNDSNASVFFHDRILVDPWAEWHFNQVKKFSNFIPKVKETIKETPFEVALISGDSCQEWKPHGLFFDELSNLTYLKKDGKYCFFIKKE